MREIKQKEKNENTNTKTKRMWSTLYVKDLRCGYYLTRSIVILVLRQQRKKYELEMYKLELKSER